MMGLWSITDLEVGERVEHVKEPGATGTVHAVDHNGLSVMVEWDDGPRVLDFAWANKVRRVEAQ